MVVVEPSVVTFARLLRQLRTEAGLTQEELAAAAGLSARSVSDLERGVALTARKETARLLADALGLAGAARGSFEAVARGRPLPEASPAPGIRMGGVAAATRTLPRDIASFTGRHPELRQLVGAATGPATLAGVVGIHAIGGMAGVGKTAFAVHAAHQLAPRFPDGQIFLPLHGHTPGLRPVNPVDALASLLLTSGVPAGQIPPELEARTALWRHHLAGKQLLLLLDDAAGSEQVRPLLPGTAGSLVLITSRRHLSALEDAQAVSLDTLQAGEAAELLARLAGRPGLDPGDPAVAKIAWLCGYLPLAVGMLARQLHHHPAWTAAELAADLAAARDRLELMHAESLSVAAAFDLSYQELTPGQQQLFRRLGLHPGTDIDAYAAAALDGTDLGTARRHLDALYDQYLLSEPAHGRYRFHDLIREHARALAATDRPAERDAATGRLVDYYQHTAAITERLLAQQTRARPDPAAVSSPPAAVPDLADYTTALAWARAERANLLACLNAATRTGQYARVVALTAAMDAVMRHDGPWTDAITRHSNAVQAARHTADQLGEADALHNLGIVRRLIGDYPGAAQALEEALGIFRDLGDRQGEANALHHWAVVRRQTGDYASATQALQEALAIHRDLGNRLGQAYSLHHLGVVGWLTGDYASATQALQEALGVFRDLGDRQGEANAVNYLGVVRCLTGDYAGATEALQEAMAIHRELRDRLGQGNAILYLGTVRRQTGDYPGAAQALEEALDIYRDLGDRGGEVEATNEAGALYRISGDLNRAEAYHRQGLALAREIESAWDEAHALAGLGRCALAAGRTADAATGLRQAREIFQRIGAAEAASMTAELDALEHVQPVFFKEDLNRERDRS
jgi:tetratricopeptide (TPR) repeat protein/transcriptional regulator with XRE-family HTH domain